MKQKELMTASENTWCPGCPNIAILESARQTILKLIKEGYKKKDFAITAGVGCHAKIFDYLDVGGFYCSHGRPIPTSMGIKLGNPNLHVMAFSGDGDSYSEGVAHFIHAGRYNTDMSLFVHDNQVFSLTTGQATSTTQKGHKTKSEPIGKQNNPIDPLKLALSTHASFVARCNARDVPHTVEIMEAAIKHKGFSFVEILQDCIIFNLEPNNKDKQMYKIPNKKRTIKEAFALTDEFDYNLSKGKIPLGIFYQEQRPSLDEVWPQLTALKKKKIGWKGLKK